MEEMTIDPTIALAQFVRGELSATELAQELSGIVSMDLSNSSRREIVLLAPSRLQTTSFSRRDVCRSVERYLSFKITAEELSSWAAVIRLLDSHFLVDPPDAKPDQLWDTLDRLMAPEVWGEIDRDSAVELIAALQCEDS